MLLGLNIRPAVKVDLPVLEWDGEYRHFRRLYTDTYRLVETGDVIIWLAELPMRGVVGQLFVSLKSGRTELSDGKTRAYVYAFRVKPAFQGWGVGTRLMDVAEADLLQRGYHRVSLNVGQTNEGARRLYERLGYRVSGTDPGRWSFVDDKGQRQEVHEPAWRMEKILSRS